MSWWTRHSRYMYHFQTETLSKFIPPRRLNSLTDLTAHGRYTFGFPVVHWVTWRSLTNQRKRRFGGELWPNHLSYAATWWIQTKQFHFSSHYSSSSLLNEQRIEASGYALWLATGCKYSVELQSHRWRRQGGGLGCRRQRSQTQETRRLEAGRNGRGCRTVYLSGDDLFYSFSRNMLTKFWLRCCDMGPLFQRTAVLRGRQELF